MGVAESLAGTSGPIVIRYRFEQRTQTNGFVAQMSESVLDGGQIELDNDQAIPRTCSLVLRTAELPSGFDPVTSLIAVFAEVLVDGTFERLQIGLFRLTNPTKSLNSSPEDTLAFRGSDVTYFLQKDRIDEPFEVPAGSNYITTVESILDGLGLSNDLTAFGATTPIAFIWEQGTASLTIVNQLLKGINHFQIAPDSEGTFRSSPRLPPRDVEPNVIYTTEQEPRFIVGTFDDQKSEATIPNIVVVSVQDPNRDAAFGRAENNDPTSSLSTIITETTSREITMDRVADVTTLRDVAEYELLLSSGVGETGLLRTVTDPRRVSNEVLQLTIETDEVNTLWRVRGWVMPLGTGVAMRHTLQRVQDFVVTLSS